MTLLLLTALVGVTPQNSLPYDATSVGALAGPLSGDLDLNTYKLYGLASDSDTYLQRSGADEWTLWSGGVPYIFSATEMDLGGLDLYNLDDVIVEAPLTDTAARVSTYTSQPPFAGVGAAQTAGANIVIDPATGGVNLTGVTCADTTGDTLAFAYSLPNGTSATVTLTEGVDYDCDGGAPCVDTTCVDNLAVAVEANATLGPLVNTIHTVGQETAFFGVVPGVSTQLTVTSSDPTKTVVTRGTDGGLLVRGQVTVPDSTAAAPGLRLTSQPSGFYYYGAGALGISVNGSYAARFVGGSLFLSGELVTSSDIQAGSARKIYWATRSSITSPADKKLQWDAATVALDTDGVLWDWATTAGTLALTNRAGGALTVNFYELRTSEIESRNTADILDIRTPPNGAGTTASIYYYTGSASTTAGDHIFATDGAPGTGTIGLSITGANGSLDLARLAQEDVGATCTLGQIRLDTGGATPELCYCQAANTWYCSAMTVGVTD